ncbi:hypothetical protein GOODEAATRI_003883 [Goodea atripinnis]|uniref:Uncharacterized protein n=1 Tax=Goodea atripinnis TaxID=208336 RepID=A0ABV0NS08_9TELE
MKVITRSFSDNFYYILRAFKKRPKRGARPCFCCLLWLISVHGLERFTAAEARLYEKHENERKRPKKVMEEFAYHFLWILFYFNKEKYVQEAGLNHNTKVLLSSANISFCKE